MAENAWISSAGMAHVVRRCGCWLGLMGLILGCISQALQPLSCLGYTMRFLVWWHNATLNGVSVPHLLSGVGSLSVEY